MGRGQRTEIRRLQGQVARLKQSDRIRQSALVEIVNGLDDPLGDQLQNWILARALPASQDPPVGPEVETRAVRDFGGVDDGPF